MTQEDKELLLKDLCVRLPYSTMVRSFIGERGENDEILNCVHIINFYAYDCKPYLRPMSSMTDEEENEYNSINGYEKGIFPKYEESFDWLNVHHFDYRGLIEKGLAIAVTEESNPYKK